MFEERFWIMPLLQKGIAMAAGRMPKIIKPPAHAVFDYLVAGTFLITAGLYWRRSKRAAISSLICGGITKRVHIPSGKEPREIKSDLRGLVRRKPGKRIFN